MAQGYYGTDSNPLAELHSERKVITPQTSGGSLDEGHYRLRTDLNSGDRIATYEINVGNGVEEVPVFPVSSTADSEVQKYRQTYIPGEGWGFVPLWDGSAAYPQLQFYHDGDSTWYKWHDSLSAIPDSESWQDNRWTHDEGSGTTLGDDVGTADGSISGATWQTGSGLGNTYLSYDGTDLTTLSNVSQLSNDTFTWTAWFNPSDLTTSQRFISQRDGSNAVVFFEVNSAGTLRLFITDGDGGSSNISITTSNISANTWNFVAGVGDNGNSATLYHAVQSDSQTTNVGSQNYDNGLNNAVTDVGFGARPDDSMHYDGDMDVVSYAANQAVSKSTLDNYFSDRKSFYA